MKKKSFKQHMTILLGMNVIGFFVLAVVYWVGIYTEFAGTGVGKVIWFLFLILLYTGLQHILFRNYLKKIVNPLRDFYQILQSVREGDYSDSFPESDIKEINGLGELVNEMIHYFDHFIKNMKKMARGDLNIQFTENGLLTQSFQQLVGIYRNLLDGIHISIRQMNEVAEDTSSATQELSSGINEQAISSDEMAASTGEISETAENIAEIAGKLKNSSDSVYNLIEDGHSLLESHQKEMALTREITIRNQKTVARLVEDIQKIEGIFLHISDIATETKMLSLNASIEAMKAGDEGKGFSAVAIEVRKLAENILHFTNEVHSVVMQTNNSVNEVKTTSGQVENVIDNISKQSAKIDKEFGKIDEETNEIVKISQFLSEASAQQKVATMQMSKTMQEASVVLKESAKSAANIAISVKKLKDYIDRYTMEVEANFSDKGSMTYETIKN
ncbi:methyl-accepting chemotaxis protein 4 [bacterium BMS3Abin05]|nr:methyl-accepting chemotaxis protein 4 [bacterium BMS3Abin05]GBE28564.1 methyl-accepting chemotaxis protein 4 [bacterium BMS3Bbin03]HDL78455.1 methyl-accepting chemotaxis protein [Bacteroidota bacterium]HDZ12340.1 methyl-accepting chemotaxis protein [Bacteroidota bacterium]